MEWKSIIEFGEPEENTVMAFTSSETPDFMFFGRWNGTPPHLTATKATLMVWCDSAMKYFPATHYRCVEPLNNKDNG